MSHRSSELLVIVSVIIMGLGLLRAPMLAQVRGGDEFVARPVASLAATAPVTPSPLLAIAPEPTILVEPTVPVDPTVPMDPTVPKGPTVPVEPTLAPQPTIPPRPLPLYMPLLWCQPRSLVNGDFEAGAPLTGWTVPGQLPVQAALGMGHLGRYAALMGNPDYPSEGGCPVGEAAIEQSFEVPVTKASLRFWYRIYSYDTLDFDMFAVWITPRSGAAAQRIWFDGRIGWDEFVWDSGWRQAVIPLENYAGQTVSLKFVNAMTNGDGWYNTWTMVDDVTVVSAN